MMGDGGKRWARLVRDKRYPTHNLRKRYGRKETEEIGKIKKGERSGGAEGGKGGNRKGERRGRGEKEEST